MKSSHVKHPKKKKKVSPAKSDDSELSEDLDRAENEGFPIAQIFEEEQKEEKGEDKK